MKIGKLIKQVSMVTVCAAMLTACSQGATTSSTQSSSTLSTVFTTASNDAEVTTLGSRYC